MSINSLSSSSTVLTIYLCTHINTLNSLLLHFVNTYLTKSLPRINPNLTTQGKTCILYIFSIMLASFAYYAGIMLNAFTTLLCSKICWHNRLKPTVSCRTILHTPTPVNSNTYIQARTMIYSFSNRLNT